ncbi:BTAD domain-containing putative transcriptional regulator [Streptomyces bluensis]
MAQGIRFVLLGAVRAYRDDTEIPVGSPQQQAVLTTLLLRRGHAVSMATLIEALWGEGPPTRAVATVRTYVWQLRRRLEPDLREPRTLVSVGDGYQMNVPRTALDVWHAESLLRGATQARAAGQHENAIGLLDQALRLWSGDPLVGVPGPFAQRQRAKLEELRIAIQMEQFALALADGQHNVIIPALIELAASRPLHEGPHGLLMRALYAAGRKADALAVFSGLRSRLVTEQGIDPGADLLALQRRILESDPTLMQAAPPHDRHAEQEPNTANTDSAQGNEGPETGHVATYPRQEKDDPRVPVPAQLPPDLPDFTGRAVDATKLYNLLTSPPAGVVTSVAIDGMGGLGKTALALHVAHRVRHAYPDGQLFANLRGTDDVPADPAVVLAGFLVALGVPAERVPDTLEERGKMFRSVLSGRRVLLVLDNARDGAHVLSLLPGSGGCGVIVTSRPCLFGVPLTCQFGLKAFSPDEALDLLGSVIGQQRVAAERAQAQKLVEACAYLPLAIRIVAARLAARPLWSVATLFARLRDEESRIAELHVGNIAISAVFEMGYRQLTPEQARAFLLLAVARVPEIGVRAAATTLALDEDTAEELLESLVDAAMMESPRPGRYRYHDLLGIFARQRERDTDAGDAALLRLLTYLSATACNAFVHAVPGDPVVQALGPLPGSGLSFPDVHSAQAWSNEEMSSITAVALCVADRYPTKQSELLRLAIDLLIAVSPFARDVRGGQLLTAARALLRRAEQVGDPRTIGRAQQLQSTLVLQTGSPAEAERHARAAITAARQAHDNVILRQALNDLGLAVQYVHRYDEAITYYDEAIALARELGHRSGEASTTINAALALLRSGRADQAILACESALVLLRDLQDHAGTAYALYVLGLAMHEQQRYDEALARYEECLAVCRSIGARDREAYTLYQLAETLRVTGRLDEAVGHATRAVTQCDEIGTARDHARALMVLGRVEADLGQVDTARRHLNHAWTLFTDLGLPEAADARGLIDALLE